MLKYLFSAVFFVALAAQPTIAAIEPQLAPFESLEKCAKEIKFDDPDSRAKFLECGKPQFAKETNPQLAERIAFWMATHPILDNARLCSSKEEKESGDTYHSDAVSCFKILEGGRVKAGYIFLRNEAGHWAILDIKY